MRQYIFRVPCQQVWTVVTDAVDANQAWEHIRSRNYLVIHQTEGNTPSGKTELVRVQEINGGENNETT